jgi:hypothetical protein
MAHSLFNAEDVSAIKNTRYKSIAHMFSHLDHFNGAFIEVSVFWQALLRLTRINETIAAYFYYGSQCLQNLMDS